MVTKTPDRFPQARQDSLSQMMFDKDQTDSRVPSPQLLLKRWWIWWFLAFPAQFSVESPAADLPPEGRSAFDHLLSSQEGMAGKKMTVPFPFDRLLHLVKSRVGSSDGLPVSVLFIPFGRSLQRFAAEPGFFRFPRIVVSVNSQPDYSLRDIAPDYQNNLYIAYVEPSNMLEIISYNPKAARFEFQIVKNYQKDKIPRVYYAPRDLCTTCHEGEVPIFPGEPWSETNDNDLLAQAMVRARGEPNYFGYPIMLKDMEGRIFSDEAQKFDFGVLSAGKKQFAQKVLSRICQGSGESIISCRALGLKVAFAAHFNYWPGPDWPLLKDYSLLMDRYYQLNQSLSVPFPFLPDRDPVTNAGVFGEVSHGPVTKFPYKDMNKNIEKLAYNLRHLPANHDPKITRVHKAPLLRSACSIPLRSAPIPYKKYCNSGYFLGVFSTKDTLFIRDLFKDSKGFNFQKFSLAIDLLADEARKNTQAALSGTYLERDKLLSELIHHSDTSSHRPKICCQDKLPQAPELLPEGLETSSIFDPSLKAFMVYCKNCHGNPAIEYPVQFLFGHREQEIIGKIKKNALIILSSLQSQTSPMPPPRSQEFKTFNPEAKKKLLGFLSNK